MPKTVRVLALSAVVLVLAGLLLVLPSAARWLYHHEGRYQAAPAPRPDLSAVAAPTPESSSFVDEAEAGTSGTVLVDRGHGNRFEMSELSVLRSRLSARGWTLEPVTAAENLAGQLRSAQALVVISPGKDWTPSEIGHVREFVDSGGRLLVVTDPTRYGVLFDEEGYFLGYDYDAGHANDLASEFGLVFQTDYLYNTVDYESNFRNIRLTDLADHELTRGIEEVVFYATHSILSDEAALIAAGGETRSSGSDQADELAAAVLAADGAVLALGDLTFLQEPYNAVADNDRFVSNIADFLAGGRRQYDLADFPLFFGDEVDLVYSGDPLLDSDLLPVGSALQTSFDDNQKELEVREDEDTTHDTLFLGLYEEATELEPYLSAAGVHLWLTDTESIDVDGGPEPTPAVTATPEITITAEPAEAGKRIEIESLGEMVLTGTALLLLEDDGQRQVAIALSDTSTGLRTAVKRLTERNLADCLLDSDGEGSPEARTVLALCPTGEVDAGEGDGGWKSENPTPPAPTSTPAITTTKTVTDSEKPGGPVGEPAGNLLIVALDASKGRYDSLTGAEDWAAILKTDYKVTTWSQKASGLPGVADCLEYDAVVFAAGDLADAFGEAEQGLLFGVVLGGVPVAMSGGYVGDTGVESVQRDLQVGDAGGVLTEGFSAGEVIDFVAAPSGSEYEIEVLEEPEDSEGAAVPFVRGPKSEDKGAPSVILLVEKDTGLRIAFLGFPLYLLPEEAKSTLALNTVEWLLAP